MSFSHTSLPQKTPAASATPAPAPSESAPGSPPIASSRPDRLSTVALVVFTSVYIAFFPLNLGRFLTLSKFCFLSFQLALYAVLFFVGCVTFRHPLARAVRQVATQKRRAVLTLIVGGIAALAIEIVGALTSSALLDLTGLSGATLQNDSNIGGAMRMLPPIVIVIVLGVLGPAVEEMVFRQLLIGLIGRFAPTWVAVSVSGILFGALHMNSPALSEVLGVLPHAFFGLGMGLLYVRTDRNLLYPASIHSLNNLSAFLPLLLG